MTLARESMRETLQETVDRLERSVDDLLFEMAALKSENAFLKRKNHELQFEVVKYREIENACKQYEEQRALNFG